ncbi:hypothetical protein [Propionimicrobium sp. PCR01-08-3]|nr:hypothetical protein [Propionimicrobium sp. PCR01-08-3]WIY83912.1 hypothetical protein QQ658_06100 [Propionimicrobium sp. PCR01-08-3]
MLPLDIAPYPAPPDQGSMILILVVALVIAVLLVIALVAYYRKRSRR